MGLIGEMISAVVVRAARFLCFEVGSLKQEKISERRITRMSFKSFDLPFAFLPLL